ncbi:MAG: SUMF1/EgtB/PvdO family nonheme iron enzyme [Myxococcota bacterium]
MSDKESRGPYPTAFGPDLGAFRTLVHTDGTISDIPNVALPDLDAQQLPSSQSLALPEGLRHEGLLGRGAMGEVHRVRDVRLNRRMALKVLKWRYQDRPSSVQRFLDEAQATAQLEHPGIVPVHELGVLPDGRAYFTMKEVAGRTLGEVIVQAHAREEGAVSLRRLVEHLRTASEAMGYAHRRGVVHRDLKPDNIMVGPHGEVLVMDWGIAKVVGRDHLPTDSEVQLTGRADATQHGAVFGTPAYMAPEQAQGRVDQVGPRTDVYALGAVLFGILYGESPYKGLSAKLLVSRVAALVPPPLPKTSVLAVPEELEHIRARAMSLELGERYADGSALADAIVAWLDGSARREKALGLVRAATEQQPRVARLRAESRLMRARAETELADQGVLAPEVEKDRLWSQIERAEALGAEADVLDVDSERLLLGALAHDGDCVEAREALADRWRDAHRDAERSRDERGARRAEVLLRSHVDALPPGHPARAHHEQWLRGGARVSLVTEPNVPVELYRYVTRHRRLVPQFDRSLGSTPLKACDVPHGSFVLYLHGPSGVVRLPIRAGRMEHADRVGPDGLPHVLRLPKAGELGPDDVFVPGGWVPLGGDPSAIGSAPAHTQWVDDFVIRRFPITNAEYLLFLDDLVSKGAREDAERFAPREKGGTVGLTGAMIYGQHPDGTFYLRPDADGDNWPPDCPVANVSWHGATAYASWYAKKTGKSWRLPTSAEWEKSGRGVDGRFFPWGDHHDPSWCCMRDSHRGRPNIARIHMFPVDESPYGVRGLAGNVRDWCSDEVADGRKVDRGGFWLGNAREARLADSHEHVPEHVASEIGFRLARFLDTDTDADTES